MPTPFLKFDFALPENESKILVLICSAPLILKIVIPVKQSTSRNDEIFISFLIYVGSNLFERSDGNGMFVIK